MVDNREHPYGRPRLLDESGNFPEIACPILGRDIAWSKGTFVEGYEASKKLENASVSEYAKLVFGDENFFDQRDENGKPVYAAGEIEQSKKGLASYTQKGLIDFARSNAKDLASLVEQHTPNGIVLIDNALGMVQKGNSIEYRYLTFEGTGSFEEARTQFEGHRNNFLKVATDPNAYLEEKTSNLTELQRATFLPFLDRMMEDEKIIQKNKAAQALLSYGISSFVADNLTQGWNKADKHLQEQEQAIERLREGLTDPEEIRRKIQANQERFEEIGRRYDNAAAILPAMTSELADMAYQYKEKPQTQEESAEELPQAA